jgi:hypothetical protein
MIRQVYRFSKIKVSNPIVDLKGEPKYEYFPYISDQLVR